MTFNWSRLLGEKHSHMWVYKDSSVCWMCCTFLQCCSALCWGGSGFSLSGGWWLWCSQQLNPPASRCWMDLMSLISCTRLCVGRWICRGAKRTLPLQHTHTRMHVYSHKCPWTTLPMLVKRENTCSYSGESYDTSRPPTSLREASTKN